MMNFSSTTILFVLFVLFVTTVANAAEPKVVNTQKAGEHPLPPSEAINRLKVPDGFQITLAAAEPKVQQPIAIAFDDRGRLWVAESYSYNGSKFTNEKLDRILIFEDTNGDGVLNRRKVFVDGLTHLTGLTLGFGGVWITAPPHLSFIPDRNRDDRPDGPPVVHLEGWTVLAEHNNVNGLTWGPDGWLYGRHGIKQPSAVGRPDHKTRTPLSCCIWRYHPTRHTFEVVADGTVNPWGLDFDDHGQAFFTTSVIEHLWHLVPGAHYKRRQKDSIDAYLYEKMTATSDHLHWKGGSWAAEGRRAKGNQRFGGGHSHCDGMIYLGDRWPKKYRGSIFMSNIHGRRINRDRLTRTDGPYAGQHAEDFLLADDSWFRAVSMEYGPDGDVYMTDWSDNGECHDRDGVHRTSGRIYKITWGKPLHVKVDLQLQDNAVLVKYQLHTNDWYVRHSRRILQERAAAGDDMKTVHQQLQTIYKEHADETKKLRALWALYVTGGTTKDWLIKQLSHSNEHVRTWAIRLLVDGVSAEDAVADEKTIAALREVAKSERAWLVQMTLASALKQVPVEKRLPLATQLAKSEACRRDPNVMRLLWYNIEPAVAAYPNKLQTLILASPSKLRQWIAQRLTSRTK